MAGYQHAGPAKGECYGIRYENRPNTTKMNQHCGKHDKIFDEDNPCPGCESEKQQQTPLFGPDDTIAEQRGTLPKKSSKKTAAED